VELDRPATDLIEANQLLFNCALRRRCSPGSGNDQLVLFYIQ